MRLADEAAAGVAIEWELRQVVSGHLLTDMTFLLRVDQGKAGTDKAGSSGDLIVHFVFFSFVVV